MRILVASHTYIVALNCEKLRALACLEPEIEVTVVVPRRWCPGGVQNTIIEAQPRQEGSFRVIPISNFSKNNQGLLTFGGDIIPLLPELAQKLAQLGYERVMSCYTNNALAKQLLDFYKRLLG